MIIDHCFLFILVFVEEENIFVKWFEIKMVNPVYLISFKVSTKAYNVNKNAAEYRISSANLWNINMELWAS